jgi:3-deoxy-D-manno-octulosonic-acid transferase
LPYGGQNLIEACAVACPVLVGPYTENFKQVVEEAMAQGAALRVTDAAEWAVQASELSNDAAARQRMGEAGRSFAAAHKGAAERILLLIAA